MKLNMSYNKNNRSGVNIVFQRNEYNVVLSALAPQAEVIGNREAGKVLQVLKTTAYVDKWNETVKCRLSMSELGVLIMTLAAESYGVVSDYYSKVAQDARQCVGVAVPVEADARA